MNSWFECKVSYEKIVEQGLVRKVTESFLVDAVSFTEAEARIIKEREPYVSGEYTVTGIKRARLAELFFNETGDKYYRAKINFIIIDEASGVEKKKANSILVQASSLKEAVEEIESNMSKGMMDYEIASVTETPILDVYPFDLGGE